MTARFSVYKSNRVAMTFTEYDRLSVSEAAAIQDELRRQVKIEERTLPVRTIAGADLSFNRFGTTFYAGIVVLRFPELQPLAYSLIKAEIHFPYVPGFLAFREVPALLDAWELLPEKPDILVADGHGIAHRRRMGIASHFGVLTGQATLGCAKSILFGKYEEPGTEKGAYTAIKDGQETIGWALRTKKNIKPVFVSPGHLTNLQDSLDIIMQCTRRYRIPEPTRLAHEAVNWLRTGTLKEGYFRISSS